MPYSFLKLVLVFFFCPFLLLPSRFFSSPFNHLVSLRRHDGTSDLTFHPESPTVLGQETQHVFPVHDVSSVQILALEKHDTPFSLQLQADGGGWFSDSRAASLFRGSCTWGFMLIDLRARVGQISAASFEHLWVLYSALLSTQWTLFVEVVPDGPRQSQDFE